MLIVLLLVLSGLLLAFSVVELAPVRRRAVLKRLSELERYDPSKQIAKKRGIATDLREQLIAVLHKIGGKTALKDDVRDRLQSAGFRHPQMVAIYQGSRYASAVVFGFICFFIAGLAGKLNAAPFLAIYGALLGFLAPRWYLSQRISGRQRELRRALPDALDLLVVCVEAGLGLNQALQRVAQEIGLVSPVLGHELNTVNLEIRAGSPRLDAIKALGERTGLDDLRSLAAMLVQTERFGTPVADALRAHAAGLRISRRQRAEEAGAKTTVKLLFPLVLFIFPPLYVVILGPAVLMMMRSMSGL
ncbi:MAG TPA: type II secretion system F family protein [Longimicrobiales bacterium]|nr:type II secretion system F family protein [Longimicrobiales bacterium]